MKAWGIADNARIEMRISNDGGERFSEYWQKVPRARLAASDDKEGFFCGGSDEKEKALEMLKLRVQSRRL